MAQLSEEQEEQLRELINSCVRIPDLRTELLDHCCCRIEAEMAAGKNFTEAMSTCLVDVAPSGFSEIEEETIFLLTLNKQLTMKKLLYFTGCMSASGYMIGVLFKVMHWPGGDQIIGLSHASLLVSMLVMIVLAVRNYKFLKSAEKVRIFTGVTGGIALSTGTLFKFFHFPTANILILCGILILALMFVPMFFWQMYQKEAASSGQSA